MFGRLFSCRLKQLFRSRSELFWVLFFPLILGTFFQVTFGNMLTGDGLDYEPAKVAVVIDKEGKAGSWFSGVAEAKEIEEIMLPEMVSEKEAKEAFDAGEVVAIIRADEELTLEVAKEGLDATVLKIFLDTCQQNVKMAMDGIDISAITTEFVKEGSLTKNNNSGALQYMYALIAMACMYGCFTGLSCVHNIMPNVSMVGARRSVAPVSKLTATFADFAATMVVQILAIVILLVYLVGVFGIDLGGNLLLIFAVCVAGCMIGVANGFFVGSFGGLKNGVKEGILIGFTMILCFFSGLMASNMKGIVEKVFPLLNRISPPALITDAFYALSMEDMGRYGRDLGTLAGMALLLLIVCFVRGRREKFASI